MTTSGIRRSLAVGSTLLVGSLVLTACGSDEEPTATTTGEGVLAEVCPETVVIQADWEPEAEHGGIYKLIGDDYTIDADAKSVTGPLIVDGEDSGVNIEIRIGGTSVGFQSAQSLIYQDRDIMFGYGRVGEYMATQADTPVIGVLASMAISPYAVYWDEETYPEVETIADLKDTGAPISVGSSEDVWVDYLVGTGVIDEDQVDRSDQNKPAAFVSAKGELAEAGFLTAEPFMYEEEIPEWGKPVKGQLIHDTGFPEYFQALTVSTATYEKEADCLKEIVPIMQQAQVDYINDATATNELVVELVKEYDTGWVYSLEGGEYAHKTGVELGVLGDSEDGVMGTFDLERVQTLIDIVDEYGKGDVSDATPETLVTNEFIDTSISAG
ncbi:ABC transporter substrate-binding protein [Nocardioides sp. cx-173]|uniref:ABC transporter substrate-binding protein n=1 Tax=Nocardioides sp. cx-173 TaxID=2898796 RepID=UPI001E38B824|nr:ABC transporter substrate-binding protein [Nocardioides sp. cx-173]MCD4524014.1 ABC transporter substrate-binding protein [Nocardioides sp. cx-173]UGB41415.1 ABC transporter substrate-binding protein [Nocardioides sp. cx-173]